MSVYIRSVDADGVIRELDTLVKNLGRELQIVSMKSAKKGRSFIAKAVTAELAVTQKLVKAQITVKKEGDTGASVELAKSKRIPLRDFKARQNKTGVSVKISKRKGRVTIPGAFTGPRPGLTFVRFNGHVMKRAGKSRLPIRKLRGPSPSGVFNKKRQRKPVGKKIRQEVSKQSAERLRYQRLRNSGGI